MTDGIVAIFLIAGCLGSGMNQQACDKSFDTFHNADKDLLLAERNFNRLYVDPLPDEAKMLGSSIFTLYRKELMFPVYGGLILDVRDRGQGMVVFKKDVP
jgi:hypothetical protein